jgi:hypothetical protein
MVRLALSAALCAFLTGCGATVQGTPLPGEVCPRPTEWTRSDVQSFIAAEHALPKDSPIWAELGELTRLRKESRGCLSASR